MNRVIFAARILFVVVTLALLAAAGYVISDRQNINGSQALTVLLSAAAAIGAIASWQPRRDA